MTPKLFYGTVRDGSRNLIHVVRILDDLLEYREIDEIAARMRAHMLSRYGAQAATVVVVQGDSKETFRLFGEPHATSLVRAALFNAALRFAPIALD
jgi:hypothetical protein